MAQPEHLGRKRSRSKCEDGGCDFTPLSKRINNLHLDRPTASGDHQCHASFGQLPPEGSPLEVLERNRGYEENSVQWAGVNASQSANGGFLEEHHPHGLQASLASTSGTQQPSDGNVTWVTQQMLAEYAPILNQTDNPHYYENNKMLYALFMERLQRITPI